MATVESRPAATSPARESVPSESTATRRRFDWRWGLAVAVLLAVALVLRLWGIKQGLPWAYNIDENAHFVPRAIGFFGHTLNPFYFVNPPGYTNLLYLVFGVWFGGGDETARTYASNPTEVFVVARATTAVVGVLGVWLLYLAGARLFDRRTGFLAAALLTVAFLPVFYSHLALNDTPTMTPVALALYGVALIVTRGRWYDFVIAGAGIGIAMAVKYTAGIMVIPVVVAALFVYRDSGGVLKLRKVVGSVLRSRAFKLLVLAGVAATAGFFLTTPYALLDPKTFGGGILQQAGASNSEGKLGNIQENGYLYYLWTMTWGIGWVPAIAALGGAIVLAFRRSRMFWILVPAAILYLLFMGSAQRYFGRWLMPLFPILMLLGAVGAIAAVDALAARWQPDDASPDLSGESGRRAVGRLAPWVKPAAFAVAVAALCGQGLVYSIHSDILLSRDDTRQLTRNWMDENIPTGAKVVVEPVVPDSWTKQDDGQNVPPNAAGSRWQEFFATQTPDSGGTLAARRLGAGLAPFGDGEGGAELGARVAVAALPTQLPKGLLPNRRRQDPGVVGGEGYTRDLYPELLDVYRREGACYYVTGSIQSQRALIDKQRVPEASRFYERLRREGQPVFRASPYAKGEGPVDFNFDWSFDYYPMAYDRPGPEMTVYRLRGARCG